MSITKIKAGSHTFSVDTLRAFRGHPFTLVFETLLSKDAPVRARDGLLIPEPGTTLSVWADRETVTYQWAPAALTDQLADGV